MKKKYSTIFIYISLVFLVIALLKADYLHIPKIHNILKLILSIILLFMGFIIQGIAWKKILTQYGYAINTSNSIVSFGLSVFGKYIPGKLWIILGKAFYLKQRYDYAVDKTITISLSDQFICLWSGLLLGSVGLFYCNFNIYVNLFVLAAFLALTATIFYNRIHTLVKKILDRILKKEIDIPYIPVNKIFKCLPYYFLFWLCFSLGFFFFADSLDLNNLNLKLVFAFPLAATIGILVILAPGGLGIREGLLFTYLYSFGVDTATAATISASSRLWYLVGETFIFLLSLFLKRIGTVR